MQNFNYLCGFNICLWDENVKWNSNACAKPLGLSEIEKSTFEIWRSEYQRQRNSNWLPCIHGVYFWNIAISFSNIKLLYPCKYIIFVPQNVLKNTYPFCIHVLLTKQIWRQYQPMGCFWFPGNIIIKLSYITFQLWWWSCITVLKYSCCCCHPKRFSAM